MVRGGVTKRAATRRAPKPTQRAQQARQNLSNAAPAPAPKQDTFAPDGSFIPSFSPGRFQIYRWPIPPPTDFANLSGEHRRFKEKTDLGEKDLIEDDDLFADEWEEFAGDLSWEAPAFLGVGQKPEEARAYAIASTFLSRAKRAFRNGKSWNEFYEEERSINSEAAAEREPDFQKKILLARDCLRNDVRLAIFEVLKARLRAEIWLEYGNNEVSEAASEETQETQKPRDSKVPTRLPTPTGNALNQTSASMPTLPATLGATTEKSTSGWKTTRGGLQPVPIFKNGAGEETAGGEESEDEVDLDEFDRSLPFKRVRRL